MSFLAPLFLIGGSLLALPILFHLIRRQPRSHTTFSSLLFLQPSPPKLTRRSRIDQWLLLLLRGIALLLIALAFARPFLRSTTQTQTAAARTFRVILLDQSASMQREDLWQQALNQVEQIAADMQPTDQLALVGFAATPQVYRSFDSEQPANPSTVADFATSLQPTWESGNLGDALAVAAELIRAAATDQPGALQSVSLVSDLQEGSSIQSLQSFAWPEAVQLELHPVAPSQTTNASLAIVPPTQTQATDVSTPTRVVVENAADSSVGTFTLQWIEADGSPVGPASAAIDDLDNASNIEAALSVTVPPGERRIARLTPPPPTAAGIELRGDAQSFDNRFFFAQPERKPILVPFVGLPASEPRADLFYFLERVSLFREDAEIQFRRKLANPPAPPPATAAPAPAATATAGQATASFAAAQPTVLDPSADAEWRSAPALFLHGTPAPETLAVLRDYARAGGTLVAILDSQTAGDVATTAALNLLCNDSDVRVEAATVNDYALLTGIDFQHRVFARLADPRYSDFSKIQIWQRASLTLERPDDWRVLASFDDQSPALVTRAVGEGKLFILAFGWQPTESQLALSSKFIPMLAGLIRPRQADPLGTQYALGDPIALPSTPTGQLTLPSGASLLAKDTTWEEAIAEPGIYRWTTDEETRLFAANIPFSESRTAIMPTTAFEQWGIPLTSERSEQITSKLERQMRDMELEQRQQWWQILLAVALSLLFLETLLSARRRRLSTSGVEDSQNGNPASLGPTPQWSAATSKAN